MQIELTKKEFRRLLDLVYIGNWVLNSTRGNDRFADYDNLESKIFALSPALSELWEGVVVPSKAYAEGGIHEAIAYYEDNVSMRSSPKSCPAGIWIIRRSMKAITTKSSPVCSSIWRFSRFPA